ncbi:MAG: MaoC family dehydratase [Candidatus Actinomarina sp.]|jgi:acyl dehydratase|nr:protein dehydratase [Actinomycetota bacterium]MDA7542977.1 MaoC family dehydratase [Acidimicrobiia bacterium]MDA7725130.1 MaoC family dehydratase [Acidimicrobiaceae bacterium]MDA8552693.1 MaoC family dehydratase [bacterium]MDA8652919.1 MaoC family dehydratase [Candidatus Actinomarina sp.]RPH01695.1 MAG: MaoC family dehydratase [bacterium TMED221]|tara:strand:- start:4163 stop:4630 length:468 start_codon:yes stop_codon:yes gene_type:complete
MKVIPATELENHIGEEIGLSEWIEVTQERINQFADATNDHQFIHVDPELAKSAPTPWDTTIAHGFLTLSLVSYMSATSGFMPAEMQTAVNYGSDKVRFMEAVPVDSKIRGRFILTDAQYKKNGRWLVKTTVTIEIEGVEKPAAVIETLTLYIVKE